MYRLNCARAALLAPCAHLLGPVPGPVFGPLLSLLLGLVLLSLPASELRAYRGQYTVEAPAMPDAGACEANAWFAHGTGGDYRLATGTLQCGLGPVAATVELGRERLEREWSTILSGALMWAGELTPTVRGGLQLVFDTDDAERLQQLRVNLPLAWSPRPDLDLVLNVGRELIRGTPDRNNVGIAIAWSVHPLWSLRLERARISGDRGTRYGVQRQLGQRWAIDLSRTHQHPWQGDRRLSWWTIGLIHTWGGPAQ